MIKADCRFFPLDRPCRFHKEEGVHCGGCGRYQPVVQPVQKNKTRILIVKLGAMGDVLRTTFLLPGLKERYPGAVITWIVSPVSVPILEGNPYIGAIWPQDNRIYERLLGSSFDVVVNMDLSPESMTLATMAMARKRVGFSLDGRRRVVCSNRFAREWLLMSAADDVKRANTRTYQYWMARIAGLTRNDYPIFTPLVPEAEARARRFAREHHLKGRVVGINPGAGKRWRLKKWTDEGYRELISRLAAEKTQALLLGGPEEKEVIAKLVRQSRGAAISAGTNNPLPDFFALVNLCDVLITGDTLALHAALGLGKRVAAVFGPTSAPEIELYGRGTKVVSPASCICCYRQECDVSPDCMRQITTDMVWNAYKSIARKI